jgi:hypothetical protein
MVILQAPPLKLYISFIYTEEVTRSATGAYGPLKSKINLNSELFSKQEYV